MAQAERSRWQSGYWVLIGVVVVVLAGVVFIVLHRDRDQGSGQPTTAPPSSAGSASGPVCVPRVTESGFTNRSGAIAYGLVVTSDCSQAAVNSFVDVTAVGADGAELTGSEAGDNVSVPVLLPGQRVLVGGTLIADKKVTGLKTTVSQTQNIAASQFPGWPASVKVTGIQHSSPDPSGRTRVFGTVQAEPASASLCNPAYYLVLRNTAGKIIFGASTTEDGPNFDERLPGGVDWSTAEISVVLGKSTLGVLSAAQLSCRA